MDSVIITDTAPAHRVLLPNRASTGDCTPSRLKTRQLDPEGGLLTELTMQKLRRFFAEETQHRPSEKVYRALRALVRSFEAMATGEADPVFYLSSLDPGMGKTSAIIKFVDVLLSRPDHYGITGVLLCVSRLEEIKALVRDMKLGGKDFGCLTSDADVNALGLPEDRLGEAQVLFTTHAMVESRCRDRAFSEVKELQYRGKPRAVRIWDESILPGREVTLSADDVPRGDLASLEP